MLQVLRVGGDESEVGVETGVDERGWQVVVLCRSSHASRRVSVVVLNERAGAGEESARRTSKH